MILGKTVAAVVMTGVLILIGATMFGWFKGPMVTALHPPIAAYDFSILRAAPHHSLPLDLRGAPFDEPQDAFAARMAAAMTTSIRGLMLKPDPALDPALVGGHRIVVAASDRRGRAQDACNPPAAEARMPAGETLYLNAALCRGERSLTAVVGKLQNVAGPEDERLIALARQVVLKLFPR